MNSKVICAAFYRRVDENVSRIAANQVVSHHIATKELSGSCCSG